MDEILSRLHLTAQNSGACGAQWLSTAGDPLDSQNPATGESLARVRLCTPDDYERVLNDAAAAFASWRMCPAPKRGEIVRQIGEGFRRHKEDLGRLIALEMGKILPE